MKVTDFQETDAGRWNAFVEAHQDGTFFHLAQWGQIAREAFGFEPVYRFVERDGEIVAVLPLTHVRRRLFGNALISTPLCVYGGGIGEPEAVRMLEEEAVATGRVLEVSFVELRKRQTSDTGRTALEKVVRFESARFCKRLPARPDDILTSIPRKQRAEVRRAMKAGLTASWDETAETFYPIYAGSVHNLGTPVFPKRYPDLLRAMFGDRCRILSVADVNGPVASVLTFTFRNVVLPYYGGAVIESRKLGGYAFLYFSLMESAAKDGMEWFDFGRSQTGSGAYAFKKNFGFEPEPLQYEFYPLGTDALPDFDPASARNRFVTSTWSRMPLPVANILGPYVYSAVV